MTNYITSYCHILSNECWINGKKIALQNSDDDITKQLYNYLEMDYPKFFKMDRLSKTAFLGVELIKNNNLALLNYQDDEVG